MNHQKWKDYSKANREEKKRWDEYYAKLLKHEHTHKDIEISAAEKLTNALVELETTAGKKHLLKLARSRAQESYRYCNRLNRQFDQKTGHGRKEGVVMR